MRKLYFLLVSGLFCLSLQGQDISLANLLSITNHSKPRLENYLSQKGFILQTTGYQHDTVVNNYFLKPGKRNKTDSVSRGLSSYQASNGFSFVYQTGSKAEYKQITQQLRQADFICPRDSAQEGQCLLFQQKDIVIKASGKTENGTLKYFFWIYRKLLPSPKNIQYAEDLFAFNSHEMLSYVFGRENVIRDVYYFSEKEFRHCSVLFPHTDRQAVFVWNDEVNNYDLAYLVIGGQLALQSAMNYDEAVPENSWTLKNNVHAGMSLQELRKLNGIDFKFYGGNSAYTGMILPDNNGGIDFKKQGVLLACKNCTDNSFMNSTIIGADEAIAAQRRLYVFSIVLYPDLPSVK